MSIAGWQTQAFFDVETDDYGVVKSVVSAANKLPIISESLSPQDLPVGINSRNGKVFVPSDLRFENEMTLESRYFLSVLLFCALGYSHISNSPQNPATGVYDHYIEPDANLSTRLESGFDRASTSAGAKLRRRGTLVFYKGGSFWQYDGVMVNNFTFEIDNLRSTFLFNLIPNRLLFDTDENSGSPVTAGLPDGSRALMQNVEFYLKPRDIFTVGVMSTIKIDEGSGVVVCSPAPGTYTGYQYAKSIQDSLNDSGSLSNIYEVDYWDINRRFKIKANGNFIVDSTGTINAQIGADTNSDSPNAAYWQSIFDALPDDYTVFDSGDLIKINRFAFSKENNLQKQLSRFNEEPFGSIRRITGTFELPRHEDIQKIQATLGSTIYELFVRCEGEVINIVDPPYYEEFNFYFPFILLQTSAPATSSAAIFERIGFEAQEPENFLNLKQFTFEDYQFRRLPAYSTSEARCLGVFNGKLHAAVYDTTGTQGNLLRMDVNSWTNLGNFLSGIIPSCLQKYDGKLYIGLSSGKVWSWDGDNLDESTDQGTTNIVDMEIFAGNLYAIDDTGIIYSFDGSSWSTSFTPPTSPGGGWRLKAWNGLLYAALEDDGDAKIYSKVFDGGWSVSYNFSANATEMSLEVSRGKLYASMDSSLIVNDGGGWTALTTPGYSIKHLISFIGNLIIFKSSVEGILAYYDLAGESTNQFAELTETFLNKPIRYEGKLIFPVSADAQFYYFKPTSDLMLKLRNEISANPQA